MPEQFTSIENFRKYQKEIYDFINQEVIQLPLFFANQPKLNNTTVPNNVMTKGGVAQRTIRDGSVQFNRNVSETLVGFDDVYSENVDDLNIIQYIANKLGGDAVTTDYLKVDAFIWLGVSPLMGPIANQIEYYDTTGFQEWNPNNLPYVYIPFVQFVGTEEKIPLRFDENYLSQQVDQYISEGGTIFPETTIEGFRNVLLNSGFNLELSSYNLTDNTGVFLP